jgi:hypothetical protein
MISNDLELRFGGLVMRGAQSFAPGLYVTSMEGWNESVEGRYDETQIPGGDGSFDVPVTLGSRLVPIKGYCRAEHLDDLRQWRNRVTGQLGGPVTRQFVVRELGETEWAPAQCVRANFPLAGQRTFASFSMTFWMPKPWRFGDKTEAFRDGETATHFGNTGSVPYFRIGGDRPGGYTIPGPGGKSVVISRPVVPGTLHEYNMTDGELYIDGALVDGGITRGDSWAIPGGGAFAHTIIGGTGGVDDFTTLLRKVTI